MFIRITVFISIALVDTIKDNKQVICLHLRRFCGVLIKVVVMKNFNNIENVCGYILSDNSKKQNYSYCDTCVEKKCELKTFRRNRPEC